MNKKFFQSALAVIAMMFGVSALAQGSGLNTGIANVGTPIILAPLNPDGSPIADYPKVAGDGTVVMRDLFVYHQNDGGGVGVGIGTEVPPSITNTDTTNGLEAGDRVILQLPQGVNFVGVPTAVAGAFTERVFVEADGESPTLTEDGTSFATKIPLGFVIGGDITLNLGRGGTSRPLDNADIIGSVILEDTDGDDGMDKATVIVATGSEVINTGSDITITDDETDEETEQPVITRRNEAIRFRGTVTVSEDAASGLLDGAPTTPLVASLTVRSAGSSDGDTATAPPAIFRLSSERNTIAVIQADAIVSPVDSQNSASTLPVFDNADPSSSEDDLKSPDDPTSTTSHLLIVPAGYETRNNSIFVTLSPGLRLSGETEIEVTQLTDGSPALSPDKNESDGRLVLENGRATLSFASETTIRRQTQYLITVSGEVIVDGLRGSGGSVAAEYFGGLNGSAIFADLSQRGTSVTLASPRLSPTDLVIGAQQAVGLPAFRIMSGFRGDAGGASATITVQAPANFVLRYGNEENPTNASCGTGRSPTPLDTAIARNSNGLYELSITLTAACAQERVITVGGLRAQLTERASAGSHELTLRGATRGATGSSPTPNFTDGITVVVAQGIEAGEVTLTNIADDIDTVGPGSTGRVDIRITESTYGSVENGGAPDTFIRIAPSANVRITGVTTNTASGSRNDFQLGGELQARPPDGSWIVDVESESSERLEVEDNARIIINYIVMSDAAIGEQVRFTFSGNAGLSAVIEVANVMRNSAVSRVGAVPSLTASVDAQATATFKIDAQYPGAINTMNTIDTINFPTFIRLIAPAGIIFTNSQPASNTRSQGLIKSGDPISTNSVSDTLRLRVTADDNLTYTPSIIVQESVAAGLAEFRIVDGLGTVTDDGVDTTRSGVTSEPIDLVHVGDGDMDELDAGADSITVAEGFSISQTVRGGLDTGEYEATSDSVEVALSEVSDGTLTITGVSVGSATITVSDELGNTDTIAVEVVAASAAPELMTLSSDGADTDATISGGVTVDGGVTYSEDGVVSAGDDISILFTINVDSEHVGEEGDIYVAVLDDDTDTFFIIDGNSEVIPDRGLAPFDSRTLTASETVEIRGGAFNFNPTDLARLSVTIFTGYTVDDLATIIYNGDGVPLSGVPLSGE